MCKRILVPVDDSEGSGKALDFAVRWTQSFPARIRLEHYIDVQEFPNEHGYGQPVIESASQYAQAFLQREKTRLEGRGVRVDTHLSCVAGKRLGQCVAEQAKAWEADLIVLGSHGRKGLGRLLLGSGAEQILREAPVPALLVRGEGPPTALRRILVAMDGSETSDRALATALQLARDCGGEVRLVHSIGDMAYLGAYGYADTFLQEVRADAARVLERGCEQAKAAGVVAQTFVSAGEQGLGQFVAEQALAWNADLVVVGTHGRRGIQRALLGSGAAQIIRQSPVSVLVVPLGHHAVEPA